MYLPISCGAVLIFYNFLENFFAMIFSPIERRLAKQRFAVVDKVVACGDYICCFRRVRNVISPY